MLLYIHVPFCRSRCGYCAFHSFPIGQGGEDALVRYTETLMTEIALWGDRLGKARVDTVFFGGGTPSLLPVKAVHAVMNRLRTAFDIAPDAEISFEANPESFIKLGYAHEIRKAGITRVSLGVQSMSNERLKILGRVHTVRDAATAVQLARQAGFSSLNIDCIWALPGQRPRDWQEELKAFVRLQPDHFSCYGLTLEEGTPMANAAHAGTIILPPEKEQATMYLSGADFLESQGYLQYEISNFARMGFQCRHNLGYWEGTEYLGLGPSAVSTMMGRRWTNPYEPREWEDAIREKRLGGDVETLDMQTRVLETIMLRLRTNRGLRVKAYRELTGRDFMKDNRAFIHALHKEGLIRILGGYLRLTRTGMLVSNTILSRLFEEVEEKLALPEGK
ncbi:radical SAM family heme chaperone HemW [Desulfovibrio sp. OttesenSCG-928-I05]|nr:radical SAM family heme chaperone HemW [Desulfovibrio sp. OttesenSCG-928-I05]